MSKTALAHCRGNFYREFAHKTLKGVDVPNKDGTLPELRRLRFDPLKNKDDLSAALHRYRNRPGIYISVYSFEKLSPQDIIDYSTAEINRIYLDFDSKSNPQDAIHEALLMVRSLVRHGIYCHCYFSGQKGVALYVEFKTNVILPVNKKEAITLVFDLFKQLVSEDFENYFGMCIPTVTKGFGVFLETLDHQVRGDIARMSRVPNTKHSSGLYCIPITFGDMRRGLKDIQAKATSPSNVDLDNIIITCMRRNQRMQLIMHNVEKQVEFERIEALKEKNKKIATINRLAPISKNKNGAISDEDIKKAKSVPLSDYTGNEKKIICPFHNDSDPSLSIDHSKGVWHCFGCGKSGDVITFVMEKYNLNFKDTVLKLTGKS